MARIQWQCNGIGWQRFIHNRQQNLPFHCVPTGQNKLSTSCQNFATQCKLSASWCFTSNVCKNVHFARLCIGHLVQPLSFRTTDVPASQWSRTWHHPGDGATLTLHSSLFNVFFKFFIPRCIVQESEVPLKKILLWNGASSWGSLKPGRGVFLKVTFCSVKHQVKYRVNLSPNYRPCYIPRRSARCPRACCPPAGRRPTPPTSSSSRTTSPCQPSG